MFLRALMAVAIVGSLAPLAPAQSLGEVARREREKREKAGKQEPVKVITEDDLRSGRRTPASEFVVDSDATAAKPAGDAKEAAGAEAAAAEEPTEEELREERLKLWRENLATARADVSRVQAEVDRIQTSLNDLTANLYGPGRADAVQRLEETKATLAQAEQRVADLEEEGRRNGFR